MPERHALYVGERIRGEPPCLTIPRFQTHPHHRREATPPDGHVGQMVLDPAPSWRVPTPNSTTWTNNNTTVHRPSAGSVPSTERFSNHIESQSLSSASPPNADGNSWRDAQPGFGWDQSAVVDASSASCDFSHLTDLDDIFTFTSNSFLPPGVTQTEFPFPNAYPHQNMSPPGLLPNMHGHGHVDRRGSTVHVPGLNPRDHEYLRNEGCFELPPGNVLRSMMRMYFRMVQPNLSIIAEDQFWSMWNGDEFNIGQSSFLLLRSMIFAATSVSCFRLQAQYQR